MIDWLQNWVCDWIYFWIYFLFRLNELRVYLKRSWPLKQSNKLNIHSFPPITTCHISLFWLVEYDQCANTHWSNSKKQIHTYSPCQISKTTRHCMMWCHKMWLRHDIARWLSPSMYWSDCLQSMHVFELWFVLRNECQGRKEGRKEFRV